MSTGSEGRRLSFVVLTVALVVLVALSGCVQGEEEDDSEGFDPSGNSGTTGSSGTNADDEGGGDDDQDDGNLTRLERAQLKGFDERAAEQEILDLMSERRERAGMQPLDHSQSLKVAAESFSRDLSNKSEIEEAAKNGTVIEVKVTEKEMQERYLAHNAYDCEKGGGFLTGQLNHITLFNRSLETSKERLIKYDNAELLALGVVEDWSDDSMSRGKMLNEGYRQAGVGVYFDPDTNIVFVTANFC